MLPTTTLAYKIILRYVPIEADADVPLELKVLPEGQVKYEMYRCDGKHKMDSFVSASVTFGHQCISSDYIFEEVHKFADQDGHAIRTIYVNLSRNSEKLITNVNWEKSIEEGWIPYVTI